jgi:hypothetical protein
MAAYLRREYFKQQKPHQIFRPTLPEHQPSIVLKLNKHYKILIFFTTLDLVKSQKQYPAPP